MLNDLHSSGFTIEKEISSIIDFSESLDHIIIDSGILFIKIKYFNKQNKAIRQRVFSSKESIHDLFKKQGLIKLISENDTIQVFITGKLSEIARTVLGRGEIILPSAALWSALRFKISQTKNIKSMAVIDLSASGYVIIGVDEKGELKDDLLIVNPRCGAGSGVNLDRILQKLNIAHADVDVLLKDYLGEHGQEKRKTVNVRADRCGVFSSSATISDKNQGIPIPFALAVTLKSEVVKVCKKVPTEFQKVFLTGGIFSWQYARDCAWDYLNSIGVYEIEFDKNQTMIFEGIGYLVRKIDRTNFLAEERRLIKPKKQEEYPGFKTLKKSFEEQNLYLRLESLPMDKTLIQSSENNPVHIGLDVGSTMAKIVITDSETDEVLFLNSYSNSGDTIETIKYIFADIKSQHISHMAVEQIGITGSARYQVQQALQQVYPSLLNRVSVLVENYAHAYGSMEYVHEHLAYLQGLGIDDINKDFCVLVDIGGEDTKLSTISIKNEDLFDNVMNIKCSAGTGSLIDALQPLLGLEDISKACMEAFEAPKSYSIEATCAVFLMESARKLQSQGYPKDEILASANWAIVENMAKTMWAQLEIPKNAVVLLHGQTMLSEPLPLAITHHIQKFVGSPMYNLVPPHPGHRACFGLIKQLKQSRMDGHEPCLLDEFITRTFNKKIIQCRGIVCGDSEARCNRTLLSGLGHDGKKFSFSLGGCTTVNEFLSKKNHKNTVLKTEDTYKNIWTFIDNKHPRSDDPRRLVIPRSFIVSEWAYYFSQIFELLGIPVHVDNIQETDVNSAQQFFNIDTCAPQIGAVGQYQRLAKEPHGIILVPQIEFVPTNNKSKGRTCTVNQGGVLVSESLAKVKNPLANFHLFIMDFSSLDAKQHAKQLKKQLTMVFDFYHVHPTFEELTAIVKKAMSRNSTLKRDVVDYAAELAEAALKQGKEIAVVIGREYILNPGIYDSHVGRLLSDKGIAALPSYVFEMDLEEDYNHIYWKNPHHILTLIEAIAEKKLHKKIKNLRLGNVFHSVETENSKQLVPAVLVSTFCCGPDSMIIPFVSEIMKKRPFLFIQSDAAIKELAHLENRVNTHVKQLEQGLHEGLVKIPGEKLEIKIMQDLSQTDSIDIEKDALYIPTLSDNRFVTSVLRAGGITCIDNYNDKDYDLSDTIKKGRKFVGDSVCAPMAGIYGDILNALEDFKQKKANHDPQVEGKERVLFFNYKGTGPCRQGQYMESHMLHSNKMNHCDGSCSCNESKEKNNYLQYLIVDERKGLNIGTQDWVLLRGIQGFILQGLLHSMLFKAGAACSDYETFQQMEKEYYQLKTQIFDILENKLTPGKKAEKTVDYFGAIPLLGVAVKYVCYKGYSRDLQKALADFSKKWIKPKQETASHRMKIKISGETYMRISQSEDIFKHLLMKVGFNRFELDYEPGWSFFELALAYEWLCYEADANLTRKGFIRNVRQRKTKKLFRNTKKLTTFFRIKGFYYLLRQVMAGPLYHSAGVPLPISMLKVMKTAKQLIPTLRPEGELNSYVGDAILNQRKGADLILNVAPEACMVSAMGELLTPCILNESRNKTGRIQHLFSSDGTINEDILTIALLKSMGPENYYNGITGCTLNNTDKALNK